MQESISGLSHRRPRRCTATAAAQFESSNNGMIQSDLSEQRIPVPADLDSGLINGFIVWRSEPHSSNVSVATTAASNFPTYQVFRAP